MSPAAEIDHVHGGSGAERRFSCDGVRQSLKSPVIQNDYHTHPAG